MDLAQIRSICVDPFSDPTRREYLLSRLGAFLSRLNGLGFAYQAWIDGSFATQKPDPEDIDILLVLDEAAVNSAPRHVQADLAALLDPGDARVRYACDLYFAAASNAPLLSYWRGWFGFSAPPAEAPKGIPRIRQGL